MAAHEALGKSDEWYTPPYVFKALDVFFDLDVAHPGHEVVDWVPAMNIITSGSLAASWGHCFVWMNPPFGGRNGIRPWLSKFMAHGDGVSLAPDRTSAEWWQYAASQADMVLFVSGKIKFLRPDGTTGKQPSVGTTLFAKGANGVRALSNAHRNGLGLVR